MSRPTYLNVDAHALKHNLRRIKTYAPQSKIIAMIKANAYGNGLALVVHATESIVDAYGVACLEEARALRELNATIECVVFQGIFEPDEWAIVDALDLTLVVHNPQQLAWLVENTLSKPIKIWIKVDTGMHRLGFSPKELPGVMTTVQTCPWIREIGLMTHLACADSPESASVQQQLDLWTTLIANYSHLEQSVANSAGIIALPSTHADAVRPGIMLYGVSPVSDKIGLDFDLQPVMQFMSAVTTIHQIAAGEAVGYGAAWRSQRPSVIGVIPVGYADGYPRSILPNTTVWIDGHRVLIVGRISMDMMTVDLTDYPDVRVGDKVELWGKHIPVEEVAKQAGILSYELMTGVAQRVHRQYVSD